MSDATIKLVVWLGVAAHLAIGIMAWRRLTSLPLVPLLNLLVALCILAYWAQRWYGYIAKGITWYLSDQWLPLYAILVSILAGLTLSGHYRGSLPHWIVFSLDFIALLSAALFFTFFRMNRLF